MSDEALPNALEVVLSGGEGSLAEAGAGPSPEQVLGEVEHVDVPAERLKALLHPRLPTAVSAHLLGSGFNSSVRTDQMVGASALGPVNGLVRPMGLLVAHTPKGLNIDTLLAEAGKVTDKTRLIYFFRNPQEDQLRKGPLGLNIHTYKLEPSAVEKDTAPRFFLVMLSYFPEQKMLTQVLLDKWSGLVSDINDASGDDEELKKNLIHAVNKVTRKFASEAFFVIDSMQSIQRAVRKLGKSRYEVKGVISNFIDKFIKEVQTCIDDVVEADLDIGRKVWNLQLSSERKVSSDEDDDEN
jgi:hypothetical protein